MDSLLYTADEFTKAVAGEAADLAKARMENAKADCSARLAQAKEEIYTQVEAYKRHRLQEIHAREGLRVSTGLLESRKALFAYRQTSAQVVRRQAMEKIRQFTAQEAYPQHLKTLLNRARPLLGESNSITLLLRPRDMAFSEILAKHAPERKMDFQPGTFLLGGLVVLSETQNLRIDLTFDTALESAMSHFVELFGMDLT